jgi:hypothetical protein
LSVSSKALSFSVSHDDGTMRQVFKVITGTTPYVFLNH